ncbi:MAG TPA: TonB-dependent receptor plug domain-containing protein [Gemmatimonadaceae bacterium]|nr:TonB-dependent receptor plug domain-containing protein [Gemmatimonadaceae bacterium]
MSRSPHLVLVLLVVAGAGRSGAQDTAVRTAPPLTRTHAQSAGDVLNRRISLRLDNVTVEVALQRIAAAAGVQVAYSKATVPLDNIVSLTLDSTTVGEAMQAVLKGTEAEVTVSRSGWLVIHRRSRVRAALPGSADTIGHATVFVVATDTASKEPLTGVAVTIDGTKIHAVTNGNGLAEIHDVPAGRRVISVRFLGYTPAQRKAVVPDTGYVRVVFAMQMGMAQLQEIVTTATGPQRRYDVANDVTIINADSIVKTQPISSVTQLLEGRVPGLEVQHTSGTPGDPSRLRLRGSSSPLHSNDPIVFVDGIQVYSAQSDSLSGNIATVGNHPTGPNGAAFGAPSPLDQIDPNNIEKIEVFKGPSASSLYGPNAANGVIVITTKKGKPGETTWNVDARHGLSYTPGKFPDALFRWGTSNQGNTVLCPLGVFYCHADSLVRFQALNDPRYSILKTGSTSNLSLGVAGGTAALTYSLTGSTDDETGLVGLPSVEADRFRLVHDGQNPYGWMRRPEQLSRWTASGRLMAHLGSHADASITTSLTKESQQRSDLEQQVPLLMTTYIDPKTKTYWQGSTQSWAQTTVLLPSFYNKVTDDATNALYGATVNWRPFSWLSSNASAGLNVIGRTDNSLIPRGVSTNAFTDTIGTLTTGTINTVVSTVNLGAIARAPLPLGFHFQLAGGANYTRTSLSMLLASGTGLAPGTSSLVGAEHITGATQSGTDVTNLGWYLEPTFMQQRFTINTGVRIDNSSSFGHAAVQPIFPKLGGSWLISEEPFFPFKRVFDVLRIRAAYGQAGVWPGPADKLRLYTSSSPYIGGQFQGSSTILSIGNANLRPERSGEFEAGFDADLFRDVVTVGFSYYDKERFDAIMPVPLPPSVYGENVVQPRNIGDIRNTGFEVNMQATLVRTDAIQASLAASVSRNQNMVTKLAAGVLPFGPPDARVVAGYPLFGRWARPILGYADANHDGIIEANEVILGDSLAYMGHSDPSYEVTVIPNVSLFKGTISVSAMFTYQAGMTQENTLLGSNGQILGQSVFDRGAMDPSAPFGQQAAAAVSNLTDYGQLQTVNLLRLNSMSVTYNASAGLARWLLRSRALSVSLQGTNLGLWTNYRGKDPNVNAFATGNGVKDTGILPLPRIWQIAVHATY